MGQMHSCVMTGHEHDESSLSGDGALRCTTCHSAKIVREAAGIAPRHEISFWSNNDYDVASPGLSREDLVEGRPSPLLYTDCDLTNS